MKILLVEDEPELSQVAAESLEHMGHEVLQVTGVHTALAALEDSSLEIDLMIADHRLVDGWGVALVVECRVKHPHVRVGIVSGCLEAEEVQLLEDYGIPYWRKPVLYSNVVRELIRPRAPLSLTARKAIPSEEGPS